MPEGLNDPEQIAGVLPESLALRLGVLADRPEEEVRVNLGLQLYGTAALLQAYGLVAYHDYDTSALELAKKPEGNPIASTVRVTELGKNVMTLCQKRLPEGEERDELEKEVLDMTDNRRVIVKNALIDAHTPLQCSFVI